ncbi:hypothetical protein DFP72DRAFT_804127, partial [Ephemerocybe angulata]
MAASIVRSTTSLGDAYQKSFGSLRPLVLIGGGSRSQIITAKDLEEAIAPEGEELFIGYTEYVLLTYQPLDRIVRADDQDNHIVCRLPLNLIYPKLQTIELRDLTKVHDGISAVSRDTRKVLLDRFSAHKCTDECEVSYALLAPVVKQGGPVKPGSVLEVESAEFSSAFKTLPVDLLRGLLTEEQAAVSCVGFKVKQVLRAGTAHLDPLDIELHNIPLNLLSRYLTTPGLRALGNIHGLNMPLRWSKQAAIEALQCHRCEDCPALHYILQPIFSGRPTRTSNVGDWLDQDPEPLVWEASVEILTDTYPPRPTTMHDIAVVMKDYCNDISPLAVEESGCCVCGQLSRRTDLVSFDEVNYDLQILEELGCTRLERTSDKDPFCDIKGPVLDSKRPQMALANHLWIGEVPECLKDLTLGECAMISRVRYNRCVVRVATGHAKMVANVVAFEHPSKKIYDRLPMAPDELSEVLSIIYTGVEPPGDDDLKRTPVLVRRHKVQNALEWLKLNHRDYADLSIDYETLGTYALEDVPIGILRKDMDLGEEGNILASAKSLFDTDIEQ